MLTRELKLKLNNKESQAFERYLFNLSGAYNWAIKQIENKDCFSYFDLANKSVGCAKQIGVNAQVFQSTLKQAYNAWDRCFKKTSGKPKLKSVRRKLRSFVFPQSVSKVIKDDRTIYVKVPSFQVLRVHKQMIPEGAIKQARIIKRASGWYCQLTIDAKHTFKVLDIDKKVGIDTGFKHLAILSDGTKIKNQRNYLKAQKKLAQVQRGKSKKKTARLHERIKNQRKDYNHKVSRKIVENYSEIYITKDNLKGQAKLFGKSVGDVGISQLRQMLAYKSDNHGRKFLLVDSKNTTMTCSSCGSLTGPTGLNMLDVRSWECKLCGSRHDRDVNAAVNILNSGAGRALVNLESQRL